MVLNDVIQKSDIITIQGNKKIGKLTLSLFETKGKESLIFSTYKKHIFLKRINAIANLKDENIQNAIASLNFLALKPGWEEYKNKFGYNFLKEDIKRAVSKHNPKYIIFHRFDLLFDIHEFDQIPSLMEFLIILKKEFYCKIFITLTQNESNKKIIETIEDFADLNLTITKNNHRIIEVKNSIYPIESDLYAFIYKDGKIEIKSKKETVIKTQKKIYVLLITENEHLINLHKYIFAKQNFFLDIAKGISETISKILSGPDIIIYSPSDEKLDTSVCTTIKEQKLHSKLIYILNSSYVRSEDKINAITSGCYDVFPENFSFEEYIIDIEKLLNLNFYTSLIKNVKRYTIDNKEQFCGLIDSLYKERIFFTVLEFHYKKTDIETKLRKHDLIYYDEKSKKYIIVLLNLRKQNIHKVTDKIEGLSEYKAFECFEWNKYKKEMCK